MYPLYEPGHTTSLGGIQSGKTQSRLSSYKDELNSGKFICCKYGRILQKKVLITICFGKTARIIFYKISGLFLNSGFRG